MPAVTWHKVLHHFKGELRTQANLQGRLHAVLGTLSLESDYLGLEFSSAPSNMCNLNQISFNIWASDSSSVKLEKNILFLFHRAIKKIVWANYSGSQSVVVWTSIIHLNWEINIFQLYPRPTESIGDLVETLMWGPVTSILISPLGFSDVCQSLKIADLEDHKPWTNGSKQNSCSNDRKKVGNPRTKQLYGGIGLIQGIPAPRSAYQWSLLMINESRFDHSSWKQVTGT